MVQQKLSALKNWQLLLCHLIFFNCSELTSKMLRILSVWRIRQMDLCSRVFIHASMLRTFEHKSAWL